MFKSLCLSLTLFAAWPLAASADDAAAVLARMELRYAALTSYADNGVVLLYREGENAAPREVPFQTRFARPASLWFTWTDHHPYPPLAHITWTSNIWSDGNATYEQWGFGPENMPKKSDGLVMSVAAATGVSHGTARHIAGLLMPDVIGPFAFGASLGKSAQSLGTEVVEGVPCDHVRTEHPLAGPVDLWIGKEDGLLHKTSHKVLTTLQEIVYRNQRVNVDIAASTFAPPP